MADLKSIKGKFLHDRVIEGDLRSITPEGEWLIASAAFTRAVMEVTERRDLVIKIAPDGGKGAPACFIHPKATIEMNGDLLAVDPASVNPSDPADRERYPIAWCGVIHEASHSDHTVWTEFVKEDKVPRSVLSAALLLEESRIEAQHLRRRPEDRDFLRRGNLEVVLKSHKGKPRNKEWAMSVAALLLARVDSGTFDEADVTKFRSEAEAVLGDSTMRWLKRIWKRAQATADDDTETMLELGKQWADLADENTGENAQKASGMMSTEEGESTTPAEMKSAGYESGDDIVKTGGEPQDGDGGKDGKGGKKDKGDGDGDGGKAERLSRQRIESEVQKNRRRGHGPGTAPTHRGWGLTGWRKSTEEERSASRRLTRKLLAASFRERSEVRVTSELPPGRVRMRAALTREVQLASGRIPTAEPFRRTERKSNPIPPLRVGIALDVSGSMTETVAPCSQAAWIIARAVSKYPESRHMYVTFANRQVDPVIFPREVPERVPKIEAGGGDEPLSNAIDLLDGELGLSRPGAARLLVALTDHYLCVPGDGKRSNERMRRLISTGCRVLWVTHLGPGHYSSRDRTYGPFPNSIPEVRTAHVPEHMMADHMPDIIIDEVVRALKEA